MHTKLTTPQTERSAISVSGPEATEFLHAQLTSDVATLVPGQAQFSAWCTPKGRVITIMLIARQSETDYLLIVPTAQADALSKRLTMFVLRADVKVARTNETITGAIAPLPEPVALTPSGDHPDAMTCWTQDNATIIALASADGSVSRRLIVGDVKTLEASDTPALWIAAEIAAGQPRIDQPLTEQFIPQSLNLDALDGVSFEKGCYPGQEIVARTFFLGRLKSRMAVGTLDASDAPDPGDRLFASDKDAAVGTVVNAITDPAAPEKILVSAVVPLDAMSSTLHLESQTGQPVTFALPPYPLPAAKRGEG